VAGGIRPGWLCLRDRQRDSQRYAPDVIHPGQGTVWPWLIGPFVEAWVRVRGATTQAKSEVRARLLAETAAAPTASK